MHEHEVAREREMCTRADRRAVHGRDRRLVELPELADHRLHADAQRFGGAPRREAGLARLRDCRRAEIHPRAEGVTLGGDQYRAYLRIRAEIADRLDDAVAHPDRERVLRVGPVEHDATDPVGIALHPQMRFGHEVARFVRMFTTDTPEPRPPALCWSA